MRQQGFKNVVGIDEVGLGSWAGPLMAAAVKLPQNQRLYKIRDSKLLTQKEREKLARKIKKSTAEIGIGLVETNEINKIGLGQALQKAYLLALKDLNFKSDFILIDGRRISDFNIAQKAVIKGDMHIASVAAASIVAKVARDKIMRQLGRKFWQYKFHKNKGYGTKEHQKALAKYGPCDIHRDYRPIKKLKS